MAHARQHDAQSDILNPSRSMPETMPFVHLVPVSIRMCPSESRRDRTRCSPRPRSRSRRQSEGGRPATVRAAELRASGYSGIFSSECAFSHVIFRKISGDVDRFSTVNVSRATHFPANRAAAGLFPWLTPPPCPYLQAQSLPNNSLFWWRRRKSTVNAGSRESRLFPELADKSPKRFGRRSPFADLRASHASGGPGGRRPDDSEKLATVQHAMISFHVECCTAPGQPRSPDSNPYANGLPDDVQEALARYYADAFRVLLKHRDGISRVTFWGVSDADSR